MEGEGGGNYPFTPHYKSKKYMLALGDQFFPKQDDVVCYFFEQHHFVLEKTLIAERLHVSFGFGKWIVSPKAVDGYVENFVVSK